MRKKPSNTFYRAVSRCHHGLGKMHRWIESNLWL